MLYFIKRIITRELQSQSADYKQSIKKNIILDTLKMFTMVNVSYNSEDNIFYTTKEGSVSFDDYIIIFNNYQKNHMDLKEIYNLYDFRGINPKVNILELRTLIKIFIELLRNIDVLKTAVVVDNSTDTAHSFLYERMVNMIPKYEYKTFSTMEGAKEWLISGRQSPITFQ